MDRGAWALGLVGVGPPPWVLAVPEAVRSGPSFFYFSFTFLFIFGVTVCKGLDIQSKKKYMFFS